MIWYFQIDCLAYSSIPGRVPGQCKVLVLLEDLHRLALGDRSCYHVDFANKFEQRSEHVDKMTLQTSSNKEVIMLTKWLCKQVRTKKWSCWQKDFANKFEQRSTSPNLVDRSLIDRVRGSQVDDLVISNQLSIIGYQLWIINTWKNDQELMKKKLSWIMDIRLWDNSCFPPQPLMTRS